MPKILNRITEAAPDLVAFQEYETWQMFQMHPLWDALSVHAWVSGQAGGVAASITVSVSV